ncbi:hypothetical protein [Leptospira bouyouniensis]|uniref:hypothetical protein n=1 Tax=Leptospira bouyouniensis TaxID=2484911 RepID=UPI001091076D|nr:hypothetical protein [Leptospira bouyouniensis]TGM85332.1 hypothetical protein EHQ99_06185 [Leptospira bouyouniensis]
MVPFLIYPFLLFFVVNGFNRQDSLSIFISTFVLVIYFYFLENKLEIFKNRFSIFISYQFILRFFVLGSNPSLSDDIYRYLFDAKLLLNGFSPYGLTPNDWVIKHPEYVSELNDLVTNMNSPDYVSVYPLLLLAVFMMGSILNSVLHTTYLGIQIIFLIIDGVNLYLVRKFYPKESFRFYWVYFANPIVLIEGLSQLHPEILIVPWILIIIHTSQVWKQGISFLVLSQLKINTIIFILGFSKKWRKVLLPTFVVLTVFVLWKLTVFSNLQTQTNRGIGLFFHSFRFSGIVEPFFYFPLEMIGYGYLSGFFSLSIFASIILFLIFQTSFMTLPIEKRLFLIYFLFLMFSPVIHSWYWILFVVLGMCCYISMFLQTLVVFIAMLSYLNYVSESYFYLNWVISLIGFGIYGIKEIDYLRKTTTAGECKNTISKIHW